MVDMLLRGYIPRKSQRAAAQQGDTSGCQHKPIGLVTVDWTRSNGDIAGENAPWWPILMSENAERPTSSISHVCLQVCEKYK